MPHDGDRGRTQGVDVDRVMRRDDVLAVAETIVHSPRSTLEPAVTAVSSDEVRALLDDLRRSHPQLRYLERLGEGGMGEVFLAEQTSLHRGVAVKTLRPERREPEAIRKMLQEAWITGALDHPNVIPVHDIVLDEDGMPRILLKRIEGVPWDQLLQAPTVVRERFGAHDLLEWNLHILEEVCQAVAYAHERGILHRDLKPENVMIGSFGEVYVVDWGIALSFAEAPPAHLPHVSAVREIAGTPGYMAPEMLDAEGAALGPHTDVYLLGSILFELLAGSPPHQGETLKALLHAIVSGPPPLPEGTPADLERICRRAMASEPSERYASATELRLAIGSFLRHRGSQRLSDRAMEREGALEVRLASRREAPGPAELRELLALFAEVRFGYAEALAAWPENPAAGRIEALTRRVVELLLAWGDPRTAASLLGTHEGAPSDLVARVEAAVEAEDAHRRSLARLEAQMNPDTGRRTRTFLAIVLGLCWTLVPLVPEHLPNRTERASYIGLVALPMIFMALGGFLTVWARESMTRTRINRFIVASVSTALGATAVLAAGAAAMGIPSAQAHTLAFVVWAMVAFLTGFAVDLRLSVSGLGYAVGFVVVVRRPELRYVATSVASAFMSAIVVLLWAPPDWLRARLPRLLAPPADPVEDDGR